MEVKGLYEKLEGLEGGAELVSGFRGVIAKLNAEAKQYRESYEKAEALLQEKTKEFKELEAQFETTHQSEIEKMKRTVEKLVKERDEEKAARASERKERIKASINAEVVDALTKGNAFDPLELAHNITKDVRINDDGTYAYVGADGGEMTIADGVGEWLKSRTWAQKSTQKQGAGSAQHMGGATAVTKEQFKSMDYTAKVDLYRTNPNLYNELNGGNE